MPAHRRFALNEQGTDYVVGDIHGCFSMLMSGLQQLDFNFETDRLFSVGDLVDRGPESEHSLSWLDKPWFFAVRGNHEEFCIELVKNPGDLQLRNTHFANGGAWFIGLTDLEQREFSETFAALPYAITVETLDGDVGIIHADTPDFEDWRECLRLLEDPNNERAKIRALWGRERVKNNIATEVAGVTSVYCGHTVLRDPCELGNVRFIDTGAVFGHSMTLVNLHTGELIELRPEKPAHEEIQTA